MIFFLFLCSHYKIHRVPLLPQNPCESLNSFYSYINNIHEKMLQFWLAENSAI